MMNENPRSYDYKCSMFYPNGYGALIVSSKEAFGGKIPSFDITLVKGTREYNCEIPKNPPAGYPYSVQMDYLFFYGVSKVLQEIANIGVKPSFWKRVINFFKQ